MAWSSNGVGEIAFPDTRRILAHPKEKLMPTYDAAVKNIEGWEVTLEKIEVSGVKTIVKDLESPEKHLQKQAIDGEAVRKLIAKLGKETVTISGRTEGKNADKVKALAETLNGAAESHDKAA